MEKVMFIYHFFQLLTFKWKCCLNDWYTVYFIRIICKTCIAVVCLNNRWSYDGAVDFYNKRKVGSLEKVAKISIASIRECI